MENVRIILRNDTTWHNGINAQLRCDPLLEPPIVDVFKEWPQERFTLKAEQLRGHRRSSSCKA